MTITRTINVDMQTRCKNAETAIRRFAKKYPELEYWFELLQWMFETGHTNETDFNSDATDNLFSIWAEKLDDDLYYIAVVEGYRK